MSLVMLFQYPVLAAGESLAYFYEIPFKKESAGTQTAGCFGNIPPFGGLLVLGLPITSCTDIIDTTDQRFRLSPDKADTGETLGRCEMSVVWKDALPTPEDYRNAGISGPLRSAHTANQCPVRVLYS